MAGLQLAGQKFNRLTALSYIGKSKWLFQCDCGNTAEILGYDVANGSTKSCGCYSREIAILTNTTHGCSAGKNKKADRLYGIWKAMRRRCDNVNVAAYPLYGGRGIFVCEEWNMSYEVFRDWSHANGYIEGLQIDRTDNNKGYSPDNCRWVTSKVNCNNTRVNRRVSAFGEVKTISEWADDSRTLIRYGALYKRLKNGWPAEKAMGTPYLAEMKCL